MHYRVQITNDWTAPMKRLLTLSALLLATPALADMPPKNMDLGNSSMSERQVIAAYKRAFPDAYAEIKLVRVPYGWTGAKCKCHGAYGCTHGNTIVYSFDTKLLAWLQGRNYDPHMANNVLRHEFARRFYRWAGK